MKQYIFNLETTKIELHFEKSEYNALTADQKADLKSAFLWSRTGGCWVSRAKEPNLWWAKKIAAKLGFTEEQREGERLSFSEQVERQAERAERRAERYEQYAENAERRGAALQQPFNRMRGDIAFLTQPIIAGHAGSQAFARQRERIFAKYDRGFEEYRKSAYFQDRARSARETADGAKYQDVAYLDRRIKECKKEIRAREKNIIHYEQTLYAIENGEKKKRFDGTFITAEVVNDWIKRELELYPGCRILVSKRNMIIPHTEENLDRGRYAPSLIPKRCPCCGNPTRIYARSGGKEGQVATLHCDNPDCGNQTLRKFVHFVGKKAMDISGISEAILDKFISAGFLTTYQDLYHLDRYRHQIIGIEGFGIKSYTKLQRSINASRKTTFARYLVAMDIPVVGRTASRALDNYFGGSLDAFEKAATSGFDFTALPDFGATLSGNIHQWFSIPDNMDLWKTLQREFTFENRKENITMENKNSVPYSPFYGCTIVATGKLEHFTRDSINSKIISLGATAGSSVTRKTSYVICGEKPGSKLTKARELGIPVLTEQEFLSMIPA